MVKMVFTAPEVAQMLNVSRPTIYKLLKNGELPSLRLGGRRYVPVEALNNLLQSASKTDGGEKKQ